MTGFLEPSNRGLNGDANLDLLLEQVNYSYSNSPFFKNLRRSFNGRKAAIDSLELFKQLPTVSKDDLNRANESFVVKKGGRIVEYVTTSGSLGTPLSIGLTRNDLERLAYNEKMALGISGLKPDHSVLITTTLDKRFMAGMAYYLGAVSIGATVIRNGIGSLHFLLENLRNYQPEVLIGVPSLLVKLIDFARENEIDLNQLPLSKAICIGEPLRTSDLKPNNLANRINRHWDIELFSTYASSEMMTSFAECDQHHGGHLIPELIWIELLDEEGNEVLPGYPGELTITPLGVEGTPLVRFRTGDIVRMHTNKCSCGRDTLRLGPVEGRKSQQIKLKGTTLFPTQIENILHQSEFVDDFIIEISKSEMDTDVVRIYMPNSLNTSETNTIAELLEAGLRVSPVIEKVPKSVLHEMVFPKGGRKPIRIKDRRYE
jgi:phenylacetate-CoA ligase